MATAINNAIAAAQRGVAANTSQVSANNTALQAQQAAMAGQNVGSNINRANQFAQASNVNGNRAANSYLTTARNLRKANMSGAANSFENAAKLAATGQGVNAAKQAGKGLQKMLKNSGNM